MLDGFDIARVIADLLALPGMKGMRTAAADLQMMAQAARWTACWMALRWCAWWMSRHTPVAISSMLSVMSCLASPTVSSCWTSSISARSPG
jgi:hypothetical protein